MELNIIGAGFGRTGTLSLKLALEQLGFGPCYHMHEVFARPGHAQLWRQAQKAGDADWNSLLAGYRAAVDWPPAFFWRQLAAHYPRARVILTVRDADAWYDSISTTIFPAQRLPLPPENAPLFHSLVMPREMVRVGTFGDQLDRAHVIDVYEKHNAEVKAALPASRLLVYDVKDGWAPLCEFLEMPIPSGAFPRSNTTQEFLDRVQARTP
ncbi:sulfotransferase family protein [Immundisolibacter sp.]|uniref:sulfotransferase family protein n=1 Tax=Immundisolibacter sp. TaxID=1934948 RepID=UPI0035635B1C